jgi:hypothetical protein
MPEFYHQYQNDPDYLGALTMWDTQVRDPAYLGHAGESRFQEGRRSRRLGSRKPLARSIACDAQHAQGQAWVRDERRERDERARESQRGQTGCSATKRGCCAHPCAYARGVFKCIFNPSTCAAH